MHSIRFLIAALLAACLFVGGLWTCARSGPPGQLIFDNSLPQEKLLGVWRLANESVPSVEERAKTSVGESTLILKPEGTFESVNLPVEDFFRKPQWSLKTTSGTWKLRKNRAWELEINLSGFSFPVSILKTREGDYILSFSVISPDSGEFWLWRRDQPKN